MLADGIVKEGDMRRFVIRDVTDIAKYYEDRETITEAELERRFHRCFGAYADNKPMSEIIEYFLHVEKEHPAEDEWEKWVERMPYLKDKSGDKLTKALESWGMTLKRWFREMPRGRKG